MGRKRKTPTPTPTRPTPTRPTEDPPEYQPGNSRVGPDANGSHAAASEAPAKGPTESPPPWFSAVQAGLGRLAVNVHREAIVWMADGIIPRQALTLVVGTPGVGKSTFGAWLCRHAQKPAIIPGSEESIGSALLPRLVAGNVALERCLILDGRQWALPPDRQRLAEALLQHQADLVWIDPIDPLLGDLSENDGQAVRHCLESLHWIAERCDLAIVAARHPGKAKDNVCPGSRQWRAVPRVVIRLDRDDGPPLRRFLISVKPYGGIHPKPREFALIGDPGEPARFSLGPEVSETESSLSEVSDWIERRKIDEAQTLLSDLLSDGKMESSLVYAAGERERINEKCMWRAGQRLRVLIIREGQGRDHRSYWELPPSHPKAKSTNSTPDTATHTQGGVCVSDVRSEPPKPPKTRKGAKNGQKEAN